MPGPRQRKKEPTDSKTPKKEDSTERASTSKESDEGQTSQEAAPGYYGVTWKKILSRIVMSVGIIVVLYFFNEEPKNFKSMATQKEVIQDRAFEVKCSADYKAELSKFKGCTPQACGRMVSDILVTPNEANKLLAVAKKGLSLGKADGGVTILDLHSGALTQGKNFINVYKLAKSSGTFDLFTEEDFKIYKSVREKIQHMLAYRFGVVPTSLHLTHPTFFSRMTDRPARTVHDEYWHVHIDKTTYPSFHYTSLLYLSDYGVDFTGGRFVFVDPKVNLTVEPKLGRVSLFTSGSENPHYVEKVQSGVRYALTVSFTCDHTSAIRDPSLSGTPKRMKTQQL